MTRSPQPGRSAVLYTTRMSDAPEAADPRYLAGVERFNAGDYFAAHEVWEELWRDCRAADRRFYHSLIQAAVAIYHAERGNRTGAERLREAGREKAAGYPARYYGIDIADFWRGVATYTEAALDRRPAARPLIGVPTLTGPTDDR
ncbi:MAG: DUF309 domain-containing protein [Gemmataceae bacterium]